MNIQIVNPIDYPGWDEMLLSNEESSFFHSSHWAKVLYESYGYKPLYFSVIDNNRLAVSIPIMEIKSPFTGHRGVSLPFTDYCRPICNGRISSHDAFQDIIEYGKRRGWKYVEIRDDSDLFEKAHVTSTYYIHTLNLLKDEKNIYSKLRSSTRRNIRKAAKEGVEIKFCSNHESIKQFYRLNCITRKRHGLPPQPYSFFNKIHNQIIEKSLGNLILAYHEGKAVAGAMFFHFGKKSIYKYGVLDRRYQHLRSSNLILWEGIRWYLQNGYESLSFGKTEIKHKGLRQFKTGWGVEENLIKCYRYDFAKQSFISGENTVSKHALYFFNKLPISFLKILGTILYKHIG